MLHLLLKFINHKYCSLQCSIMTIVFYSNISAKIGFTSNSLLESPYYYSQLNFICFNSNNNLTGLDAHNNSPLCYQDCYFLLILLYFAWTAFYSSQGPCSGANVFLDDTLLKCCLFNLDDAP